MFRYLWRTEIPLGLVFCGLLVMPGCAGQGNGQLPPFAAAAATTPQVQWDPDTVEQWAQQARLFLAQGQGSPLREEALRITLDIYVYLEGKDLTAVRELIERYRDEYPNGRYAELFAWKEAYYRVKVWEYGERVEEPVTVARSHEGFLTDNPNTPHVAEVHLEAARAWMNAIVVLRDFAAENRSYSRQDAERFAASARRHAELAAAAEDVEVADGARQMLVFIDRELASVR